MRAILRSLCAQVCYATHFTWHVDARVDGVGGKVLESVMKIVDSIDSSNINNVLGGVENIAYFAAEIKSRPALYSEVVVDASNLLTFIYNRESLRFLFCRVRQGESEKKGVGGSAGARPRSLGDATYTTALVFYMCRN